MPAQSFLRGELTVLAFSIFTNPVKPMQTSIVFMRRHLQGCDGNLVTHTQAHVPSRISEPEMVMHGSDISEACMIPPVCIRCFLQVYMTCCARAIFKCLCSKKSTDPYGGPVWGMQSGNIGSSYEYAGMPRNYNMLSQQQMPESWVQPGEAGRSVIMQPNSGNFQFIPQPSIRAQRMGLAGQAQVLNNAATHPSMHDC